MRVIRVRGLFVATEETECYVTTNMQSLSARLERKHGRQLGDRHQPEHHRTNT